MPQFALETEIKISRNETLSVALNGILLENPTWKVVTIHTIITGKIEPVLLATVVIDAPLKDMPDIEKEGK